VKDFFATYAPGNFAVAVERSGVAPAALGAGYAVFFAYSALIGVFAIGLSFAVLHREEREVGEPDPAGAATKPAL
jgi:PAT family beta-lactamase induction signal transducer AmpG